MAYRELTLIDLEKVYEISILSMRNPWSKASLAEALENPAVLSGGIGEKELIGFSLMHCLGIEAEIYTIALIPEYQGKGYGGLLLDRMLQALVEKDIQRAFLEVSKTNNSALSLYQSRGFKKIHLREKYYRYTDGIVEDAWVMAKDPLACPPEIS